MSSCFSKLYAFIRFFYSTSEMNLDVAYCLMKISLRKQRFCKEIFVTDYVAYLGLTII